MATTDCLLYKWDLDAVERMASPACAALAAAWRNLVLYAVGAAFSATCDDVRTLTDRALKQPLHRKRKDSLNCLRDIVCAVLNGSVSQFEDFKACKAVEHIILAMSICREI